MALKYVIGDDEIWRVLRVETAITSLQDLIDRGKKRNWFCGLKKVLHYF